MRLRSFSGAFFKPGIAVRLAGGIGLLLSLLVAIAALGLFSIGQGARASATTQDEMALEISMTAIVSGVQAMRRHEKDVFLSLDQPAEISRHRVLWEQGRDATAKALYSAREQAQRDEDGRRLKKLKPSLAAYEAGFVEAIRALERGDVKTGAQARDQMALLEASADLIEEQVQELGKLAAERVAATRSSLVETSERARTILLTLSAMAIVAGTLAGWLVARSVTRPLARAGELVGAVARGDLTARPGEASRDEIGRLVASISEMNQGLGEIVREVRNRSEVVHQGAIEIRTRNLELSSRTESQAAALEQSSAAVASFASAARSSAVEAANADSLAREASRLGRQAGAVTGELLERFAAIENRSRQIGEIVSLVESIAFQTNILALNAAIEAARAGEAGRGFSVVAAEVRRLSLRTTEAAREINALVITAGESVAAGGRLATDTGKAIEGVVGRIELLGSAVAGIANATAEQKLTVEQIGEVLSQLDRATQDNADLAEKTSVATAGMEEAAAALGDAVARFRIPDDDYPSARAIVARESISRNQLPKFGMIAEARI